MRLYERYRESAGPLGLVFERYHKLRSGLSLFLGFGLFISVWFLCGRNERELDVVDCVLMVASVLWIGTSIGFLLSEWRLVIAQDSIFILDGKDKRVRTWARSDIQQVILFYKPRNDKGVKHGPFPWRVDFSTLKAQRSRSGLKFCAEGPAREMAKRLAEVLGTSVKEEPG